MSGEAAPPVERAGRVLVVSSRLPVTVRRGPEGFTLEPSAGGLATGIASLHERSESLWIGWSGEATAAGAPAEADLAEQLAARRLVPVPIEAGELERFYERVSNGVLWPVFHYQPHPFEVEAGDWAVYEAVNQRFADAVAAHHRDGDRIWVHDYQLLLVPGMLRRMLPRVRIGFFLHIPFPSSEVFRQLAHREEILEGLLGADVIGFHAASYMRCFAASVTRILGVGTRVDRVRFGSREIRMGVHPMGIDARGFAQVSAEPAVVEEARALRGDEATRLLVGIDRLDYTKGIPRRLLAFERLLERHPELHGRIRLVQVAVPSREDVRAYQTLRANAYELVGRIHGRFATPHWVPIYWIHRAFTREAVVALYRAADVMLVTPIRDGMNLVAKEFVASRTDGDGVLVLSEFAGAASELAEALHVNPFDVDGAADVFHRALAMRPEERRSRMRALQRRVFRHDVEDWAKSFLDVLAAVPQDQATSTAASSPLERHALGARLRTAKSLALILDYDGTLVPYAETPDLASPGPDLLSLLGALAQRGNTELHVVSGRARESLERLLGGLPAWLHAEHGLWARAPNESDWSSLDEPPLDWWPNVLAILDDWSARTPGSLVEEKSACVAWHYRGADPEFGAYQAKELQVHLRALLSNVPVEILAGEKIVEVRPHGANKGRIVPPILERNPAGTLVAAFGDDATDEDLFAALPEDAVAVHVGPRESRARFRLAGVEDTRALLARLL